MECHWPFLYDPPAAAAAAGQLPSVYRPSFLCIISSLCYTFAPTLLPSPCVYLFTENSILSKIWSDILKCVSTRNNRVPPFYSLHPPPSRGHVLVVSDNNHWPPDRIYDNQSTTSSKPPIRSLLNSRRVVESLTCLLGGRGTCRVHSADNAFRPPPFRLQLTTNHKSLHPVDQPGFLPSTHVVLQLDLLQRRPLGGKLYSPNL